MRFFKFYKLESRSRFFTKKPYHVILFFDGIVFFGAEYYLQAKIVLKIVDKIAVKTQHLSEYKSRIGSTEISVDRSHLDEQNIYFPHIAIDFNGCGFALKAKNLTK
jgi:hypothetical protein